MKRKAITKCILFLLFVAGLFVLVNQTYLLLQPKKHFPVQYNFSKIPRDSLDIVFIGTSHQFCSIDPDLLYEEYGINSYMLSTSAQTVPMSYYAAMEAIELQHPAKIVFEVCYCANDARTISDAMSHHFFDGMPSCKAKQLAINDLIEAEKRIYFYLPLGVYHSRWKELERLDFTNDYISARGGVHHEDVEENEDIPLISPDEKEPMPAEMEKYMDKLVALCKENNVELILYAAPFNTVRLTEEEKPGLFRRQRIFNYISDYAAKNQLEYHNLFYEIEELGLNNETDWKDTQHLNCKGQEKFTRYMVSKGYF